MAPPSSLSWRSALAIQPRQQAVRAKAAAGCAQSTDTVPCENPSSISGHFPRLAGNKVKDGKMTTEEADQEANRFEANLNTPAEQALWQHGASNAGSDFLIRGRKSPVVALRHRKMTWHLGG